MGLILLCRRLSLSDVVERVILFMTFAGRSGTFLMRSSKSVRTTELHVMPFIKFEKVLYVFNIALMSKN